MRILTVFISLVSISLATGISIITGKKFKILNQYTLLILLVALALASASCQKLPKKVSKEEVGQQIPTNWSQIANADIIKDNNKALNQINYRNFFTNKELVAMIDLGVKNNKDLKIAALNVKSAFDYYRIKRSDLLPKINAGADASRQKISRNSLGRFGADVSSSRSFIVNNFEANLATANFEIDLFNKLKYINEAAFHDFLSKIGNQNAIEIALISQIANSYIQWSCDIALTDISKKIVAIEAEKLKITKASYDLGLSNKYSLLRTQESLNNAKSELATMEKAASHDKNILLLLTGRTDDQKLQKIAFNDIKLSDKFYINLSSDILLLRPDVMSAEFALLSQDANIKAARASFFPSISLTGSYGFVSNKLSNLVSTSSSGAWRVGAGVNIPIFSGFKNAANLQLQKNQRKIALEQYKKTLQQAFVEVEDKLATRKSLKSDLENKDNIFKSNQEMLTMDQKFYELGNKNKIELLNSEKQLLISRSQQLITKKQFLINQIELYKSLGGGLTHPRRPSDKQQVANL